MLVQVLKSLTSDSRHVSKENIYRNSHISAQGNIYYVHCNKVCYSKEM